jgi:hypothetical protein
VDKWIFIFFIANWYIITGWCVWRILLKLVMLKHGFDNPAVNWWQGKFIMIFCVLTWPLALISMSD